MKKFLAIIILVLSVQQISAQNFTRKDSLQGGLRVERTAYDVLRYDLDIAIDPDKKTIKGHNDITLRLSENPGKIQIDLFDNMSADSIILQGKKLKYTRDFNAVFVEIPVGLKANTEYKIRFYYSGTPKTAKRAPWDGGFDWKKDPNGKHWIGVAVQGTGASLWYPCKDSQTDEPDYGATIKVAVPNGLMNVSNGRFMGSQNLNNGFTRWDWELKNPVNNYDITINIADYVHIHDNHKGLDLDYYVLRNNEAKARKHFEVVKPMMDCFQSKFGKFPFTDDGYKLVETPYLGMEHQSAVAYGNRYLMGYLGNDISGTGVGMLFDYIIIHESGHEWFGNSITSKDIADMWIHEGFTTYTETVFVECLYGYDKAMTYINGQKINIANDRPIIGQFGVNSEGSGDMYAKGSLLLNTLRHVVADDAKWWAMLLKYSETFRHKIIDTPTVISFFNAESGMNLTPVFNQYLQTTKIPMLALQLDGDKLTYQWEKTNADFNMPIDIEARGRKFRLQATTSPQVLKVGKMTMADIKVATHQFFVFSK